MNRCVTPRACFVAVACLGLLLGFPDTSGAQQVRVAGRLLPTPLAGSPLFTVEVFESRSTARLSLPAMTLVNTPDGAEVTRLSLALPAVGVGGAVVTPRIGDQQLPGTFLYSPLSGASVHRSLRGISLATRGRASWSLAVGRLAADPNAAAGESSTTSLAALALTVAPHRRLSVIPRILMPLGSDHQLQASAGAAVRAEVGRDVMLTTDVALAESAGSRWAPLASVGVLTRLRRAEIEALVVRGAASPATWDMATAGSADREQVAARMRALPGLTFAARAGRLRPAGGGAVSTTTFRGFDVAHEGSGWGRLSGSVERTSGTAERRDTTRIEWRPRRQDLGVRYIGTRTARGAELAEARRVELELRPIAPVRFAPRVHLRAALAFTAGGDGPQVSSLAGGRIRVAGDVHLTAETELALAREDESPFRRVSLASDVGLVHAMRLHIGYSHHPETPFAFGRAFDVRISKTIDLSTGS